MTTTLLERALWLCNQLPRFHEYSYEMGTIHPDQLPLHLAQMRIVMEMADRLQIDIANHIKQKDKQRETA